MKFAVINDIHFGETKPFRDGYVRTLSHLSEKLLMDKIKQINSDDEIDFVVNLGDLIVGKNSEKDMSNFVSMLNQLKQINKPLFSIIGNHEQKYLDENTILELLGRDQFFFSHDIGNLRLVFLHTIDTSPNTKNKKIILGESQIKWFKKQIQDKSKKILVFSHHSLSDQDTSNNVYFSKSTIDCLVNERGVIRQIINESENVLACINAHLHWNNVTIHTGIPYITLQSLVENFNLNNIPSNTHTIFEIDERSLKFHVFGNDRFEFMKYL